MNTKKIQPVNKVRRFIGRTINNILKIFCALMFVFPFYWMLSTSFKTYVESEQFPPTLYPHTWSLEGYLTVFDGLDLGMYLKNSLIVIIAIIVLQILVSVPAAYAYAVYKFKFSGVLFGLVLVAFMIPSQVTFIAIYLMFSKMQLLKTYLPQILPFGANAFGIFMLRQHFKQISTELIESARLDQASEFNIMMKIMLPIAKPTMVTTCLLSFISHWNAYFWPLVMTNAEEIRPLTIAISKLKDLELGVVWPTIMAGNALLVVPMLLLFLAASKKIIASMAYRGMK